MSERIVKIGAGCGWAGDPVEPGPRNLVERVDLDYLTYESTSESTVSWARERMLADPTDPGYDPLLDARMNATLKLCFERGTKIITNQGWANAPAARKRTLEIARELGLKGLKVASVTTHDITDRVREVGDVEWELGAALSDLPPDIVVAECYQGADGMVQALAEGADVVITSRITDNSLSVAPLVHEFGWSDVPHVAVASAVGHMLECGILGMSGGFMADPPRLDVPGRLDGMGLPYAEVSETGDVVFSKAPGTGGRVTTLGLRKKLMHEVGDTSNYIDANVTLDLSTITFESIATDRVRMANVTGKPRPEKLKVNIACREGFMTQDFAFYAGPRALQRAQVMEETLHRRIEDHGLQLDEFVVDLIGYNGVFRAATPKDRLTENPWEVGVRIAAKAQTRRDLLILLNEFDGCGAQGPFGTGKGIPAPDRIRNVVGIYSTLVARDEFTVEVIVEEA